MDLLIARREWQEEYECLEPENHHGLQEGLCEREGMEVERSQLNQPVYQLTELLAVENCDD